MTCLGLAIGPRTVLRSLWITQHVKRVQYVELEEDHIFHYYLGHLILEYFL